MYDAITPGNVPAGATLVAGYGDGYYQDVAAFKARFPGATVVEIAVFASDDLGTVLDVETGDATPAQAPGWVQMRRHAGIDPTVYCNSNTWPSVRSAFAAAGVPEPHYWIAAYDGDPTIPAGAVAKQYSDPGPYDLSSVADYWPGVDPAPSPSPSPVEPDMPQWINGPVVPGAQPTVVLVPHGAAWSGAQNRTLHLGMDQVGAPNASASVRVAVHNGSTWKVVGNKAVTAAGGTVDVDVTGMEKVSLQTDTPGVSYAIETW